MVQIKLSIAFVLAAAAIAPVVAQPIGSTEPGTLVRVQKHKFKADSESISLDDKQIGGHQEDYKPNHPKHHHGHHHHDHHRHHSHPKANRKQSLERKTKDTVDTVDTTVDIAARELAELDNLLERSEDEAASGSGVPSPPSGPVIRPKTLVSKMSHYKPMRLGNLGRKNNGLLKSAHFGMHNKEFLNMRNGRGRGQRLVGREYAEPEDMLERDFEELDFEARELPEFDNMFERDFGDVEFEAREFDDERYLD